LLLRSFEPSEHEEEDFMSLETISQKIRDASRDDVITGDEIRAIIEQLEADGSPRAERRAVLRFIRAKESSAFTDDARVQAIAFMDAIGADETSAPLTETDALRLVLDSFDVIDAANGTKKSRIDRADLQSIIDSPKSSERLKAAARYVLAHFSQYQGSAGLSGAGTDAITKADLGTAIEASRMTGARAIDILRANFASLSHFGFGGRYITRSDLEEVLKSSSASPEMKAAARYLLAHPELIHSDADGTIRLDDLDIAHEEERMSARSAIQTLFDNFDYFDWASGTFGFKDGYMSKAGLEYALKDPDASIQIKAAARFLLDHPELLAELGLQNDKSINKDVVGVWLRADAQRPQPPLDDEKDDVPARSTSPHTTPRRDAFDNEVEDVLGDPSLTIEDQVALVIMLIMKQMDREIQHQTRHISDLQKAQGKNGKDTSIDVETMKLKRTIDKRGQMFDMLRQIIDRYNQTAKAIIDTIGR
jgi:hypothetical protein